MEADGVLTITELCPLRHCVGMVMHTLCYGFSTPSLTLSLCAPSLVEPAVLATPPVAPLALLVVSLSSSSSLHTLTSSSTRLLNPSPFPSSHPYPHLLTPSPPHPLIYSPSEPFTPSPPHTWPCLLSASPSVSPLTPPHLLTPSPPHTLTSSPLTSSYPHLLSPPHLLTSSPPHQTPLSLCWCVWTRLCCPMASAVRPCTVLLPAPPHPHSRKTPPLSRKTDPLFHGLL